MIDSAPAPDWSSPDGAVRLYCGDALELLPRFPRPSIDHLITDPPYSSGGQYRSDRLISTKRKYVQFANQATAPEFSGDNRDQRAYLAWVSLCGAAAYHLTRPGGLAAIFTDWRQLPTTTDAIQAAGYVQRGIAAWCKPTARPKLGRLTNSAEFVVWGTKGPRALVGKTAPGFCICSPPRGKTHTAQKPEDVLHWLLTPAEPGETVLDPFMGSGTTGIVAHQRGLQFIGIEQDASCFEDAVRRFQEALP